MKWQRALVTGASSGIGEAIARQLAEQGTELVLVARRRQRLEQLAAELEVPVELIVADLGADDQLQLVVDRLQANDDAIDLLVNNAGVGTVGDFLDTDARAESNMLGVNVAAVHVLCRAGGSAMVARGGGAILNVSSIAGFAPTPRSATYGATKAFVTSLSESLHVELGPQGVVVSCLCPGLTRTEFHEQAGYRPEGVPQRSWQSADQVAAAGLDGLARGKALIVPGGHNKAAAVAAKVAPSSLVRRASGRLAKLTKD